ncbi:hypothetical protein [Vagococcus sp.]|uniref:hypothetical protein n=1 Tax=Vagococcus sp. TaxID=1933889 RepID=UPI003F9E0BDD
MKLKKIRAMTHYFNPTDWFFHFSGFLMFFISGLILFAFSKGIQYLIVPVALVTILKGFFSYFFYYYTYDDFRQTKLKNVFIFLALANISLGVILIFTLFSSTYLATIGIAICLGFDTFIHFILLLSMEVLQQNNFKIRKLYYTLAFISLLLLLIPATQNIIGPNILISVCLFVNGINLLLFQTTK